MCFNRKIPPCRVFYAGEMIKCMMLWCVTCECHLQQTAKQCFLEDWLIKSVWMGLCLTVSAGVCVRACVRVHISLY